MAPSDAVRSIVSDARRLLYFGGLDDRACRRRRFSGGQPGIRVIHAPRCALTEVELQRTPATFSVFGRSDNVNDYFIDVDQTRFIRHGQANGVCAEFERAFTP